MADKMIEQLNAFLLKEYKTRVLFTQNAMQDYKSFSRGKRNDILRMLTKQAEKGALLKPEGNGNHCQGPLYQFGKIKSKSLNLRIIYRPSLTNESIVEMGIIAIGPRDNMEVYRMAIEGLNNPSS